MKEVEYIELKKSKKFTPALYYERNGSGREAVLVSSHPL